MIFYEICSMLVYMDDILIFSKSKQEVRLVLQRLLENQLFVKAEKCSSMPQKCPSWDLSSMWVTSGHGQSGLAYSSHSQGASMVSGICSFLPTLHSELQFGDGSPHQPHLTECFIQVVLHSSKGFW